MIELEKKLEEFLGKNYKTVFLKSYKRYVLEGWHAFTDTERKGVCVLFHNLNGSKEKYLKRILFMRSNGYEVVCFDLRGHGNSRKKQKYHFYKYYKDAEYILQYVKKYIRSSRENLILYGFSIGTYMASWLIDDAAVSGVILDSGPSLHVQKVYIHMIERMDIKLFFKWILKKISGLIYRKAIENGKILREKFEKANKPILFIHGNRDSIVRASDSQEIYSIVPSSKKKYYLVENSYHLTNERIGGKRYNQEIIDFLKYL